MTRYKNRSRNQDDALPSLVHVGNGARSPFVRPLSYDHTVEVNVNFGGLGCKKICPTWEDVQIAHQIWTELVTRKAAIPVDPENDVIAEIYDSWYALFQRTRQLVGDIPGKCIRREKSTQQLVKIATESLNLGLRPHLTKWQARYRNWWRNQDEALKATTPQEQQKKFPQYQELITEMLVVNKQMIEYASQLQKLVKGKLNQPVTVARFPFALRVLTVLAQPSTFL